MPKIEQNFSPDELEDDKLLLSHATLHFYWRDLAAGRGVDGWTQEKILEKHREVVAEMESRGIEHEYMNELDSHTGKKVEMQVAQSENTEAETWARRFIQAENKEQFAQENTPELNWFSKAVQFVQNHDSTIDVSDYISFSPIEQLSEWETDFIEQNIDAENPTVFCSYMNEDTGTGVFLTQYDGDYHVNVDGEVVLQTECIKEGMSEYVRNRDTVEISQQGDNWVVPSNPDDYELAEPDTSWDEVELSDYAEEFGYDEDASWDDFSEEDRTTITRHYSASASGNPAESFDDLWGGHHLPDGRLVLDGVNAALAESESNTPLDIRNDIEANLNEHQEEFEQAEVVKSKNGSPGSWYVWNIDQAEEWLENNGFETDTRVIEDNFISFVQIPEDELDEDVSLTPIWRGREWEPDVFIPNVDDYPILFVVVDEEDVVSTQVQAVKFQVRPPREFPSDTVSINQEAIESDVSYHWYVWDEDEAKKDVENEFGTAYDIKYDGTFTTFLYEDKDEYENYWTGSQMEPEEISDEDKPKMLMVDGHKVVGVRYQTEEPEDKEGMVQ